DLQVLARSGGMLLHSEQVQLFGGTGKLLLMQNNAGKQEYWLVVDRPQQLQANLSLAYVMILSSSKQNDTATKQAILDLAKSWTVPNE
ncbi:MAG: hypothetical protein ACXVP5_06815, partial [Tumebacillaceae bacterium]